MSYKSSIDNDIIHVKIVNDTANFSESIKALQKLDGSWNDTEQAWEFPNTPEYVEALHKIGAIDKRISLDVEYPSIVFNRSRIPNIRDYQVDAIKYMLSHKGRILLADDVGLGKTLSSLFFFQYTKINYPILIVCTASTKSQWEYETARFDTAGLRITIVSGKHNFANFDADVVIVNYDLLSYAMVGATTGKKNMFAPTQDFFDMRAMDFQGIILDECQRIKSPTAMSTRAIRWISKDIPCMIAMSGTPIENKPIEFFNILNLLRPDIWHNYDAFGKHYCNGHMATRWEWHNKRRVAVKYLDYSGASNLEELYQMVSKHVMFRRNKHDAIPNLPKAYPVIIPLKLTDKEMSKYKHIIDGTVQVKNKSGKLMRLKDNPMLRKTYLKEYTAKLKLEYTVQFLKDFMSNSDDAKIVVFTEHHDIIDELYAKFVKTSVKFDGRCTQKQKGIAKEEFISGGKRIFFGQIASAGVGLDGLQNVCNTIYFIELPYKPSAIYQGIGRLERTGSQATTVAVYFPILRGTVEEDVMELLAGKEHNMSLILDGGSQYISSLTADIHKYLSGKGLLDG